MVSVSTWTDKKWLQHWYPECMVTEYEIDPFSPAWKQRYGDLEGLRTSARRVYVRNNRGFGLPAMFNVHGYGTSELVGTDNTNWEKEESARSLDSKEVAFDPLPSESAIGIQ